MAYDGVIMQRAIARFDQARQRRAAEMEQRRRMLYARQPRLEEIERTLRGTMSRIVAAAAKKGEDPLPAIRALRERNQFDQLPEKLKQAARVREENPEASLTELAGLVEPKISKPAMSHRLKRLVELAREEEQ